MKGKCMNETELGIQKDLAEREEEAGRRRRREGRKRKKGREGERFLN